MAGPTERQRFSEQCLLETVGRNRNAYCHPGDMADLGPQWLLVFDDPDRGWQTFDNKREALLAFARAEEMGWNCHLWRSERRDAVAE